MPPATRRAGTTNSPIAAALAWAYPGAGHLYLGQRVKGWVILVTLTTLYLLGILIGGIDVIDSREDKLWFAGQVFYGPITIVADRVRDHLDGKETMHGDELRHIDPHPQYVKSIGRVNEIGTLYCAMAGLLNLLAIIDVLVPRPPTEAEPTPEPALRGRVVQREDAP